MDAKVLSSWEREFSINTRPSAGVEADLERAIYAIYDDFDENDGPRFSSFCQIWKDMKLALIFSGRDSFRDLFELTVDIFQKIKPYSRAEFQQKENNVLVRYAAVYLLYAFYFKQPCRPRARIRLSYDDFKELSDLMVEARQESHLDVLYAWSKLIISNGFHYSVVSGLMGLEVAKSIEKSEFDDITGIGHRASFFKTSDFRSMTKRMGKIHDQYVKMKESLVKEPDAGYSLSAINVKFMDEITELTSDGVCKLSGVIGAVNEIGEKRKKLKDRFYESDLTEIRPRFVHEESESEDETWVPEDTKSVPKRKRKKERRKKGPQARKSDSHGKKSRPNDK